MGLSGVWVRIMVSRLAKILCLCCFFLSDILVDGPQNGASPQPWDIKVQVPQMFQEDTKKFRIPHSSLVKVICQSWVENQALSHIIIPQLCWFLDLLYHTALWWLIFCRWFSFTYPLLSFAIGKNIRLPLVVQLGCHSQSLELNETYLWVHMHRIALFCFPS